MSAGPDRQTFRRGVWLYPGVPALSLVDAVVAAEQCGLDEVWIADEGVAREPMAVLAAAALRTSTIRLGVGITSPLLRHPGAIAATLATIQELSDGRAVLGLGVGGHESLDPFELRADRPVALLGDAITMARAVLAGTPTPGYEPPPHRQPDASVPIWVGARGAQLTRTGARLADGLFLSGCTSEEHMRIVPDARSTDPSVQVALYQSASDIDERDSVRRWSDLPDILQAELGAHSPDAIGVNLVDLRDPGFDAPRAVEGAAAVLAEV
ncbi:MAG: LLM class flavin-dependent oxidoreductase [Acidimicrobiales bacterium]